MLAPVGQHRAPARSSVATRCGMLPYQAARLRLTGGASGRVPRTAAGMNEAAGRWLEELGGRADGAHLPIEISTLALRLRHLGDLGADEHALPRLRVRTRSGRWGILHTSWVESDLTGAITVIIDAADPADVASLIMLAHGLTDGETTITELVCRGRSTKQMTTALHLSGATVSWTPSVVPSSARSPRS
jgi:hypothetical protein